MLLPLQEKLTAALLLSQDSYEVAGALRDAEAVSGYRSSIDPKIRVSEVTAEKSNMIFDAGSRKLKVDLLNIVNDFFNK